MEINDEFFDEFLIILSDVLKEKYGTVIGPYVSKTYVKYVITIPLETFDEQNSELYRMILEFPYPPVSIMDIVFSSSGLVEFRYIPKIATKQAHSHYLPSSIVKGLDSEELMNKILEEIDVLYVKYKMMNLKEYISKILSQQ